jgi:ribonuclease T2
VVHGFWPQYERGYPQNCAGGGPVSQEIIQRMLPLMPNAKLIQHEWSKHGTCSGLNQDKYFATVEQVYSGVEIPADFKGPIKNIEISPAKVKGEFVEANHALPADAFRVLCQGRFLSEVRVCFTKDLQGRACGADVRDTCSADPIIMRPVR